MKRPRRLAVMLVTGLVVLSAAGVATGLVLSSEDHKSAHSATSGMTDTFHRSDRNISGDRTPYGTRYQVDYDPGRVRLQIHDDRLVRGDSQTYGTKGAPILLVHNPALPVSVSARFIFTRGPTREESVVVGTCARSFGFGSVQLAVSPMTWTLFYLWRPAPRKVAIVTIERHVFRHPLRDDGRTVYASSMTVDLTRSAVRVAFPGGSRSITNPAIAKYWGKLMGIQVRRPQPTDGDAQVVEIGDRLTR